MAIHSTRLQRKLGVAVSLATLLTIATCMNISASSNLRSEQLGAHKQAKSAGNSERMVKELPVPFQIGEALTYQVAWAAFPTAASVHLSVAERRNLLGLETWHFRASAHTVSPVRSLFVIDDQFDSYTDTATLESRQYEMYLDEMGSKQGEVVHFLPEGETAHGTVPGVVVLPGTQDPLGALYALRVVDWQHSPEFRVPVYDGRSLYEMWAQMKSPSEMVTVPAGSFLASKIVIRMAQHGKELTGISVTAWLSHDAAHTPVLLQAGLPFGNLRVELTSKSQ